MRAVKVKQLRAIANYAGKRGLHQVGYYEQKHKPKWFATGKLTAEGKPEGFFYTPITIRLADCVRNTYKQLKKAA